MPFFDLSLRCSRIPLWIIALALATLSCMTITRGVTFPQTPSIPNRDNGLIAYLGTDGNLYLTDENGTNHFPITDDAQSATTFQTYQYPTWSLDGQHLAFVSFEGTEDSHAARLLAFTPETGATTELFSDPTETPFYLYWSPDNESISFLTSATKTPHLFLRLAFLNGEPSRIADTGQPYYWAWAPDGKQFFVHEGGLKSHNPSARLTLSSPTDELTQTFELAPANFQAPAWSPDGTQLLAAIVTERHNEFVLLDLNGSKTQTLTEFITNIAFSWSPNGERIAYLAATIESNGFLAPLTVLSAKTPANHFTSAEKSVLAYFWAPNSQKIAYITLDTSEDIQALIRTGYQKSLQLGLYVMDVQTGTGHHLIHFEPTEEFLSILPVFDQYHHSATIWSPDSTKLVVPAIDAENQASLWVVSANGGKPVYLADGTLAFWSWK